MVDDKNAEGDELPDAVEIPIDGTLDLHWFHPRDIRTLVPDYLVECQKRGIYAVRIVHGKGTGALKKSVHALLSRSEIVADFRLAGLGGGGWGATEVDLIALTDADASSRDES